MAFGAVLGQSSGSNFSGPIIQVSAPTGSTVTLTKGDTTMTPTEQSGAMWVCRPWEFGIYTVQAVSGNATYTQEIEVSEVTLYYTDFENVVVPDPVLNNNPWSVISQVSSQGNASAYWAVGDAKQITINATIGTVAYDNYQPWVYILGFNHNSALEGENLIHFGCFRSGQTYSATNGIALDDSYYPTQTSQDLAFHMNTTNVNAGGWATSYMRQTLLDADAASTDSAGENSFLNGLPSDLLMVMKQCTKYTDNTGNSNNALNSITATQDWCWLLSEYEVQGTRVYANIYEQNYQRQYEYYVSGNSKIKYKQSSTETTLFWWNRSPRALNPNTFCRTDTSGNIANISASYSQGVAPGFCV